VDEAETQRRLGVEALARDEVASRRALADPAERERRDHSGNDAELHLGERKSGSVLCDDDVRTGNKADPTAKDMPVHDSDDRGGTAVDRLEHSPHRVRIGDVRLEVEVGRRAHPLDVGPGAEARAVAGEHDRSRRTHVDERGAELLDQSGIECVSTLRSREGEAHRSAVPLDPERAHVRQPKLPLMPRLHGAIAAASTPLGEGGAALDTDAFVPYADFLVGAGLDGILAFGTNGEAVLLSTDERRMGLERWLEAVAGRVLVAAHCGAQTTADTVALAAHAAEAGADAVAVIGPPYFKLDTAAQRAHLAAAAGACAPLPFYVYEFAATAGYAFDPSMLLRLREETENVVGMKVSDTPWEAFERYLLDGFDVFVGPEALIHLGRQAGAVGAVSALASAFPEEVARVVHEPSEAGAARLAGLRAGVESFPRHAALKRIAAKRGVPLRPDVRAPLRDLDEAELVRLDEWLVGASS